MQIWIKYEDRGILSVLLEEDALKHERGSVSISRREGIKLLAYAGRDTGTSEVVHKYPDNCRRELELCNLHRALGSGRYEDDGLVIVFDFFNVIALFNAGITNAVALMDTEESDHQVAKLRELDNPSGRFTVVVSYLDQAAGEALACKLVSIGYVHLAVPLMHEALSECRSRSSNRCFRENSENSPLCESLGHFSFNRFGSP